MSTRIVLLILLTTSLQSFAQGEFKLLSKHKKSDINYLTIKNINQFYPAYDSMITAFQPVKGEYTVYIFVKEFLGESVLSVESDHPDTLVPFHDLIVLKTKSDQRILDAYYYRLEWVEPPGQFMVFRSSADSLYLVDNLPVSNFRFLNEYEFFCPNTWEDMYETDEYGRRIPENLENDLLKF